MKYLEPIKLAAGLILILFGIYFGYLLLKESYNSAIFHAVVFSGPNGTSATYTPIYAGLSLLAGSYLLSKVSASD